MEIKISTKFIAELIGTFSLVLFGCCAAVVAGADTAGTLSGLGLPGHLLLPSGLFSSGNGLCYRRYIWLPYQPGYHHCYAGRRQDKSGRSIEAYIIAQLIGAVLASFVLMQILKGSPNFAMGEWALGANG